MVVLFYPQAPSNRRCLSAVWQSVARIIFNFIRMETMETGEKQEMKEQKKRSLVGPLVGGIVVVALLALGGYYGMVRMQTEKLSESGAVLAGAKFFHIPVAKVNGVGVSYAEYVDDKNTLRDFYAESGEALGAVTEEELSDMSLSRLVATELVIQVADKFNVTISQEEIDAKIKELMANFASEEEALTKIQESYGWTLDTYTKKVIIPVIREEKLQAAFLASDESMPGSDLQQEIRARHILFRVEEESEDATVKQAATEVLERIQKGEDFATLAAEFGSDGTKDTGGDLGWFGRGVMVPEFEEAAFALEPGQLSGELVQTMFGYHIIKVEEERMGKDFVAFMDAQFAAAKIDVLLPVNNPFELFEQQGQLNAEVMPAETEPTEEVQQ